MKRSGSSRLIVAADLAQTHDFTAICVNEVRDGGDAKPVHRVRHLERLPLGTSYPGQVERIAALVRSLPPCELVVDQTGVGRPVVDMLREKNLLPEAVTITAGDRVHKDVTTKDHRVPKRHLVSRLQVALQTDRLHVAASLAEARRWADEMLAFQVEISAAGHDSYGNDETLYAHDDLVLATALAVWWGEERLALQIFI